MEGLALQKPGFPGAMKTRPALLIAKSMILHRCGPAYDQRHNFGAEPIGWTPVQPDRRRVVECVNGAAAWELPGFGGLIASE